VKQGKGRSGEKKIQTYMGFDRMRKKQGKRERRAKRGSGHAWSQKPSRGKERQVIKTDHDGRQAEGEKCVLPAGAEKRKISATLED